MTIIDVMFTVALALGAIVFRPHHARCADGAWLPEGVRRNGSFVCAPKPIGGAHFNGRAWIDDSIVPMTPPTVVGWIYCTGGSEPIDVDGVRVSCQARH